MEEIQPGIYRKNGRIYTCAASENDVYGETFIEENGVKYRRWHPQRSKAGAAVMKGIDLEVEKNSDVLYLGAASGTTVSHFSDILEEGFIVAVEYSDTVIRDLLGVAEDRHNIAPVLGDARKPEKYSEYMENADVVFQDISQRDQDRIFIRNCDRYLKEDGTGLLAVKARSISATREAEDIYQEVRDYVEDNGYRIVDEATLEPYEKEHLFLKIKKK
ncbi:MAG: fibrillarin-like rRNA/tRNA 2'-O-methyltransferase [Candidatus Nanohaloarchaea archaeon]